MNSGAALFRAAAVCFCSIWTPASPAVTHVSRSGLHQTSGLHQAINRLQALVRREPEDQDSSSTTIPDAGYVELVPDDIYDHQDKECGTQGEKILQEPEPPKDYSWCQIGGRSGPSIDDVLVFENSPFLKPPATLSAVFRTEKLGEPQIILGWAEGADLLDAAELRLSSTGNLELFVNNGNDAEIVEADDPRVNLADGNLHRVIVIRETDGLVKFLVDGNEILEKQITIQPKMMLNTALSAPRVHNFDQNPFDGQIGPVFSYNRVLTETELNTVRFVACHVEKPAETVVNLTQAKVFQNLGCYGPDDSRLTRGCSTRFGSVGKYGGLDLDLLVKNVTHYEPFDLSRNGLKRGIAWFNLKTGTRVKLQFDLVAHRSYHKICVGDARFVFVDIDRGSYGTSVEKMIFTTRVAAFLRTMDASLENTWPALNQNLVVTAGFKSTGDASNNPADISGASLVKSEKVSFGILTTNRSGFRVIFETSTGPNGRSFGFCGTGVSTLDMIEYNLQQGENHVRKQDFNDLNDKADKINV